MKMKYKILKIKNKKEEVIGNNLELKEAYKMLLNKFNELYADERGYSGNWSTAIAKSRRRVFGAYKTLSNKTRSFDYDGVDYVMVEDEDDIEVEDEDDIEGDVYQVEVEFKVKGYFEFRAADRYQAAEYAEKHCGAIFDNYQSSLPDADWNFPVHPEKKIKRITKVRG